MISAQKSMAALTSFSLLRNFCNGQKDCCECESLTKTLFLSKFHKISNGKSAMQVLFLFALLLLVFDRYLWRASATHDEEDAITADSRAPTIFDKIIAKEIPSYIVYENDKVLAFKDINPQALVHDLVIPKVMDGLTQLGKAEPRHEEILGQLLSAARIVAEKEGVLDGFRVVINNGPCACQSVYHIHLHVLGGRQMSGPPG